MTDEFFADVNRKCATCGKLIADEPHETIEVEGGDAVEVCSAWCGDYYREHRR